MNGVGVCSFVGHPEVNLDLTLQLPDETMQLILDWLDPKSLSSAVAVCKRWRRLGIDSARKVENSMVTRSVTLLKELLSDDIFAEERAELTQIANKPILKSGSLGALELRARRRKDKMYKVLTEAQKGLQEEYLQSIWEVVCQIYFENGFTSRALKASAAIPLSDIKCKIRLDLFEKLHELGNDKAAMDVVDKAVNDLYHNAFRVAVASRLIFLIVDCLEKKEFFQKAIKVANKVNKAPGRSAFYKRAAFRLLDQHKWSQAIEMATEKCGRRDRSLVYQEACYKSCEGGDIGFAREFSGMIPSPKIKAQALKYIAENYASAEGV